MVRRITVSVSDELGEKIDKWKRDISPSAIFQMAVAKKIEEKEDFIRRLKEEPTMAETIARLKEEKSEAEHNSYREGAHAGLAWAKAASYSDLRYAAEVFSPGNEIGDHAGYIHEMSLYLDETLGSYFTDILHEKPLLQPGLDENRILSKAGHNWVIGWQEAVFAFWLEVTKQI